VASKKVYTIWLNISGIAVPFVLTSEDRSARDSVQPVTLFLTVIVTPNTTSYPILAIDATNLQSTEVNEPSPGEYVPSIAPGSVNTTRSAVATGSEALPLPADCLPSEMSTPPPAATNRLAGMSLAENALREAKDAMTTINLCDTWESALERIKWVMDTLGPVAEVRINGPLRTFY
jgi:hypothetical protein